MTKKLKFLAFALFAVLACVSFASCSDDDKDEPNGNNSIVGKWNCYKVVLNYDGKTYPEDVDFDFKADNSFTVNMKDGNGTLTGKYTTTEAVAFTVKFDGGEDAPMDMSGTYTISGNELVAKYQWDNSGTAYLKRIK